MKNFIKIKLFTISLSLIPSISSAGMITYEGDISAGNTVTGTLQGSSSSNPLNSGGTDPLLPEGRDFWTFSAVKGDVISITAGRLDGDLELAFGLYYGTTAADELDYRYAPFSFGGMSLLKTRDDNWGPYLPGPFADPQLLDYIIKYTGTYTVAVVSTANGATCLDGVECSYALALDSQLGNIPAVVPVPAALWLFGSGLLGLISVARRNA